MRGLVYLTSSFENNIVNLLNDPFLDLVMDHHTVFIPMREPEEDYGNSALFLWDLRSRCKACEETREGESIDSLQSHL